MHIALKLNFPISLCIIFINIKHIINYQMYQIAWAHLLSKHLSCLEVFKDLKSVSFLSFEINGWRRIQNKMSANRSKHAYEILFI